MDSSLQFVGKDWGQLDMTRHGKDFLLVLEAWNLGLISILPWEIQISYWLQFQINCWTSTRIQTSLLLTSYDIWSKYSTHARILKITTFVNSNALDWLLILAESSTILIYSYLLLMHCECIICWEWVSGFLYL